MDLIEEEFITYSLPGSTEITSGVVQSVTWVDTLPNKMSCDFIIAPFDKNQHKTALVGLQPFDLTHDAIKPFVFEAQPESNYATYCNQFDQVMALIDNGQLNKLVLSRTQIHNFDSDKILNFYHRLVKAYPNAFVYCINLKDAGCWIGASPELLLEDDGQAWKTVALAGTKQKHSLGCRIKWSDKELQEQQYILDFLKEEFESKGIEYKVGQKYVATAGEVAHIKSDIFFESKSPLRDILDTIHPGPAISGMPKAAATKNIHTIEKHDRSYYAGYLGPVGNKAGQTKLFVNLRCLRVVNEGVELYLGGGLVKTSNAESEWQETNLKAQTLTKVLMPESKLTA